MSLIERSQCEPFIFIILREREREKGKREQDKDTAQLTNSALPYTANTVKVYGSYFRKQKIRILRANFLIMEGTSSSTSSSSSSSPTHVIVYLRPAMSSGNSLSSSSSRRVSSLLHQVRLEMRRRFADQSFLFTAPFSLG